jgi:hypothetical protein
VVVVAAFVNRMILLRVLLLLLTKFARLAIDNNELYGTIPTEFRGLTRITSLRIVKCFVADAYVNMMVLVRQLHVVLLTIFARFDK